MNPAALPRNKSGRVKLGSNSPLVPPAPEAAAHGASTDMQAPAAPPSPASSMGGPAFEGLDPFSLSLVERLPRVRPPRPDEDIISSTPAPAADIESQEPAASKPASSKPSKFSLANTGKTVAALAGLVIVLVIARRIMAARAMAAEIPARPLTAPARPDPQSQVTYL